ncbi:hypothetical protein ER616_04360 [Streptococcus pyogenes]|nr:hypothetical protein ER616_04360 [Streptococcus pyogenes]
MNQESQNNKLNAKDLINVGIFTARTLSQQTLFKVCCTNPYFSQHSAMTDSHVLHSLFPAIPN